ncbi:MAG: hypothetical protein HKN20_07300 [Gemmatimonadetes bacterium]|nr:hypothetical protein [Gemmatimonadota bacterium]
MGIRWPNRSGKLRGVLPALLLMLACSEGTGPLPPPPGTSEEMRGFVLADWTRNGYGFPTIPAMLDEIVAVGATHLAILVTGYQPLLSSSSIRTEDFRTPDPIHVRALIREAQSRGIVVSLKPHVDLDTGEWRGDIAPADPDAWFASYRDFLYPWLDLAEQERVDLFLVGTEFRSLTNRSADWRSLIAECRARFSGRLTYAAAYEEAFAIDFWNDLDFLGVDFYEAVAGVDDPDAAHLAARWVFYIQELEELAAVHQLPVLFTEIGYRSVDGAGRRPFDFETFGSVDVDEQADLYRAALEATGDLEWFAGIFWWNWLARGRGGLSNQDFTPRDKPAEEIVRGAWGASLPPL